MTPRRTLLALGFAAVIDGTRPLAAQDEAPLVPLRLPVEPLVVETRSGPRRFDVEIAADDASRARGLMFRRELPSGRGMLFDFESVQPTTFWMRNTLIPLDLLFITANGVIARIHENARPHDETPIASGVPVLAVLEIAGGEARRLGIATGDIVRHRIFRP